MTTTVVPDERRGEDDRPAALGGSALILAALLFIAVFSYLAARFDYPEVLDGPADRVLPRLIGLGAGGRAVWALYAMIPLLLVPAGAAAERILGTRVGWLMKTASSLALIAAFAMMLGLMRWPSVHWALATGYLSAGGEPERAAIATVFDGLNLYLGNYIGEFLGELALNGFFLLAALGTRGDERFPRWTWPAGVIAALLGLLALWRNVTPAVALLAEVENLVLPMWMIVFGWLLVRAGRGGNRASMRVDV